MIFDVISENFFMPLSAPSRREYYNCICTIYDLADGFSFGVDREIVMESLKDYYDNKFSVVEREETQNSSSSEKASSMIRNLVDYGWINIDTDKNYVQKINFNDYAIKVIKTLKQIDKKDPHQYRSHIYTIYLLCRNIKDNPVEAIQQIESSMDDLISSLKSLNSNIKKYMDQLSKEKDPSEIISILFDKYHKNIIEKLLHRLLTTDNIHKYSPDILNGLTLAAKDDEILETMIQGYMDIEEIDHDKAKERVLSIISNTINNIKELPDYLEEIKEKNSNYQNAAIQRAQFQLINTKDVRGQLRDILCFINQKILDDDLDDRSNYELEELTNLYNMFVINWLSSDSLYTPQTRKSTFINEQFQMHEISFEQREKQRQALIEKLKNTLTPKNIDDYVYNLLKDKKQIKASEILTDIDQFTKILYIRIYGQRNNMTYKIEKLDRISINGYNFTDFNIILKEKKHE